LIKELKKYVPKFIQTNTYTGSSMLQYINCGIRYRDAVDTVSSIKKEIEAHKRQYEKRGRDRSSLMSAESDQENEVTV